MLRGFAARRSIRCALAAASIALLALNPMPSHAQSDVLSTTEDVASVPEDSDVTISDVQITGNKTVTKKQIFRRTRHQKHDFPENPSPKK